MTRRAKNRLKRRAHRMVEYALAHGRLQRQPCACGNPNSQAHHHDYNKPLDVTWLCPLCHAKEHHVAGVIAVMLTADRPQFVNRAVACYRAQTYPAKRLLILDSGKTPVRFESTATECALWCPDYKGMTIGALRNAANAMAHERYNADILAHFDDDDWSHPLRLAWQVRALKSHEGMDAVGYRSMLFYDSRPGRIRAEEAPPVASEETGQAWLYTSDKPGYALGTSLMYWRRTWESHYFREDVKFGEDNEWIKGLNLLSDDGFFKNEPAMIAEMHGANLTDHSQVIGNSPNWVRVPEWDKALAERMRL